MAVYAIGDVQGCYDELKQLLLKIRFDPTEDELWLTGDLVNRGPKSLEVLRYVRELGDRAKVVLGNHDLHLLALAYGGRNGRRKDTLENVLAAPDAPELMEWLRQRPLLHHDECNGWTLVHAGISPQWSLMKARKRAAEVEEILRSDRIGELLVSMYGNTPDRWNKTLSGMDRYRYIINVFTRMRYCRKDKSLELEFNQAPEKAPSGLVPWFAHSKRKCIDEPIVFGHWSTLGYRCTKGVVSLDTGCVWGGSLTAVELGPNSRTPTLAIQLPCAGALKPAELSHAEQPKPPA